MIFYCCEEIMKSFCCSIQEAFKQRLLIRLKAARHTIFIYIATAVSEAAFADILPGAGSVDITAPIDQKIFSITNISKFICEQYFALNGVSTLIYLPAAVSQVETDFPGDVMIWVLDFQECSVSYGPLLLFKCAGNEID